MNRKHPEPRVTIEVPTDSQGRSIIGAGAESTITIRAEGERPVTVELGQKPTTALSGGVVFFGSEGTDTSTTVTTTGSHENIVHVRVRGDQEHASAFHDDLTLTASVDGTVVAEKPITVLRVDLDESATTLLNDMTVVRTITTTPVTRNLNIAFRFFRKKGEGVGMPSAQAETFSSVHITPLEGHSLTTGHDGTTQFQAQAGHGGQGGVFGQLIVEEFAFYYPLYFYLTQPCGCDCCCAECAEDAGPEDTGWGAVGLYAGERRVCATDLDIPGRGMGFELKRTYRSQASHLRLAASGDSPVDWAFTYIDDLLKPDGHNVIVFRPSLRTDVFVATEHPDQFYAPMEFYEQLTINHDGNYELRSHDGMVKTYRGFHDHEIPGRLIRAEDRDGNYISFLYGQPKGLSKTILTTVVDTMGRNIQYRYYDDHDSNPGRRGRLKEIEDFRRDNSESGRKVIFDYDEESNLISVTSPVVLGTPNGNDFPYGKTVRYDYTREEDVPLSIMGADRQRLLHNLISVQHPNETAVELDPKNPQTLPTLPGTKRESVTYGTELSDPASFDRVETLTLGGTNGNGVPAGGTILYKYELLAVKAGTPNDPFLKNTVTDRRGHVTDYFYSAYDTLLKKCEFTHGFRKQEPKSFITTFSYNYDKELLRKVLPEGNRVEHYFDEHNPDRFQQGNEIRTVWIPDAQRGGDQKQITTETIFEPIYPRPVFVTGPRGVDNSFGPPIADPSGRTQRERYTTRYFFDYQEAPAEVILPLLAAELRTSEAEVQRRLDAAGIELGLGDLNEDGKIEKHIQGHVIRMEAPPVVLLAGSNQAAIEGDRLQHIVTLSRFNQFGQKISERDPEGNVHLWRYFPETDPDGDGTPSDPPADGRQLSGSTGGYLREAIRDTESNPIRNNRTDSPPTNISTTLKYDTVGNKTSEQNGRGIRTDYFVNELSQVVQTIRAAAVPASGAANPEEPLELVAFAYVENTFYDFNNNVTRREVEDRGNTSNTGGFVAYTSKFDILNNLVEKAEEVDIFETLVYWHRYDANGNQTLEIWPEGNAVAHQYDERDLHFQMTRGALNASDETLGAPPEPYDPRGGVPSTMTWNYDRNKNMVETVDAADTDGSPDNNSQIAGLGDVTRNIYDGFDRKRTMIDAVSNVTRYRYDPVGNLVNVTKRGPIGDASPTNMDGLNNVDLEITEYQFDELSRLFQKDRLLFVPTGVSTQRPPSITDAELTPGDGKVSMRYEYDRNSRQTFKVEDDLDTSRTNYDGVARTIMKTDPERNTVEYAYDGNHNLIEMREIDVSQITGISDETFLTTYFYDSLDRLQSRVNNLGQTWHMRYDSRDNLMAIADAQGPLRQEALRRRAFVDGELTINTVNEPGNVKLIQYDGINRRLSEDRILTKDGQGDGVIGVTLEGVRVNPEGPRNIPQELSPDTTKSGDGLITVRYDWDKNSLLASILDDNGNQTQYSHDNLNRRVTQTNGNVVAPALTDRADRPTTITMEYDSDDNLVRLTDENGSVCESRFDAINRQIRRLIARGPGVVGTTEMSYEYDGLSRLTLATDNNEPEDRSDDSVNTYIYDSLSRVIEATEKIGDRETKVISSGWRAEDLQTSLTYPNGRALEYRYDGLDRLASVADRGAAQNIANYQYIGVYRVLERRYPINGTQMTYLDNARANDIGYDGLRRPIQLRHLRADNSLIVGFTHTYDRMSNKLTEEKLHDPANSEVYAYDSTYRLISFDRPNVGAMTPLHSRWTIDGVGNWQQVDDEVRQHSSFNELVVRNGMVIDHDANGNEIDDGTFTFQWDYRNRLRAVTRKADGLLVGLYTYDAVNRRIRKVVTNPSGPDVVTDFYYDGWRVIEERDGTDNLVQQYVYGGAYIDELLLVDSNSTGGDSVRAVSQPSPRLFYHQNALFSTFALTDQIGTIVEGYQYDAYGRVLVYAPGRNGVVEFGADDETSVERGSRLGNPYCFTARRLDVETALYHYRNRYFDTAKGRFISRDPLGTWSDVGGFGNAYAYVGNRAVSSLDPFGYKEWKAIVALKYNLGLKAKNKNIQAALEKLSKALGESDPDIMSVEFKLDFDCYTSDCMLDHAPKDDPSPKWIEEGINRGGDVETPHFNFSGSFKEVYSAPSVSYTVEKDGTRCADIEITVSMTQILKGAIEIRIEGLSIIDGEAEDPPEQFKAWGRFKVCCCCVEQKETGVGKACDWESNVREWSESAMSKSNKRLFWNNRATMGACGKEKSLKSLVGVYSEPMPGPK